jgi:selenocysteine lyase/cysteine desulfurase
MQIHTGWQLISPKQTELRGPLLSFELPKGLQEMGYEFMYRLLSEKKLQIAMPLLHGQFCLRLSPHVYLSEEEITKATKILGSFK